jgi:hypothetical protein
LSLAADQRRGAERTAQLQAAAARETAAYADEDRAWHAWDIARDQLAA